MKITARDVRNQVARLDGAIGFGDADLLARTVAAGQAMLPAADAALTRLSVRAGGWDDRARAQFAALQPAVAALKAALARAQAV